MIKLLFCVGFLMGVWGKVVPFDKTVVDYVFKQFNPCVFFLSANTTSDEIKTAFYEASSEVD
jgi:predicted permease